MNIRRRKILHKALDALSQLKDIAGKDEALAILNKSKDEIELCCDEEQMAMENRPESFMWSAGNTCMEDNISDLTDASTDLDVVIEELEEKETYCYQEIHERMVKVFNLVTKAIHR